jgi:hypothetical protein
LVNLKGRGEQMSVSKKIRESIDKASWVRKMFEEGALRKARYGPGKV